MLGFVAGLYVAGGVWYYKQMEPYEPIEKATVVVWPAITAFAWVIRGLDYMAYRTLKQLEDKNG
jgi:hypothetical protein